MREHDGLGRCDILQNVIATRSDNGVTQILNKSEFTPSAMKGKP